MKCFVLFFCVMLGSAKLLACSCSGLKKLTQYEYDNTDYVFIGKVEKIESFPKPPPEDTSELPEGQIRPIRMAVAASNYHVYFKPIKLYQGTPDSNGYIVLQTSASASACGVDFYVGQYVMAFSYGHISSCSRYAIFKHGTTPLDSVEQKRNNWIHQIDSTLSRLNTMKDGWREAHGAAGLVRNGKRQGRWDFGSTYGKDAKQKRSTDPTIQYIRKIKVSIFYRDGIIDSIYHFNDGKVSSIDRRRNGTAYGWQDSFDDGALSQKSFYDERVVLIEEMNYDKNGIVTRHLYYRDQIKTEEEFYPGTSSVWIRTAGTDSLRTVQVLDTAGVVYMEGTLRIDDDSESPLFYISKYVNPQGEQLVTNGTGIYTEYFPSGSKHMECVFKNGLVYGGVKSWYENKEIGGRSYYRNKKNPTTLTTSWEIGPGKPVLIECLGPAKSKAWNQQNESNYFYFKGGRAINELLEPNGRARIRVTEYDSTEVVELLDSAGIVYLVGEYRYYGDAGYYGDADGELLYLRTYVDRQGDTLVKNGNGTFVDFYSNGKTRVQFFVKDGKVCTKYSAWYADGMKSEQSFFRDRLSYHRFSISCELAYGSYGTFELESFMPYKKAEKWAGNGKRYYYAKHDRDGEKHEKGDYRPPLLYRIGLQKELKLLEPAEPAKERANLEEKKFTTEWVLRLLE